jgi:heat shock protein HslJ
MKVTTVRRALLVFVLLAVTGCGGRGGGLTGGSADGAEPGADSLWGHTFLLTEGYRDGDPMTILAGTEVSLRFGEDHRLVANAGCNTMSGQASLDGGELALDGLQTTDMGCDEPRMAQDKWVGEFLTSTPTWELADGKLTLRGGGTELVLADRAVADPARPLTGTVWTVDTLVDGQTASSVPAGAPPATVEFGQDTVRVFAGCNSGSAGYRLSGDTITFEPLALTKKACPGDIMTLESAVVAVLEGSVTYGVESDVLTLKHRSGKGLQLRAE